jgi:hypothetical protein
VEDAAMALNLSELNIFQIGLSVWLMKLLTLFL